MGGKKGNTIHCKTRDLYKEKIQNIWSTVSQHIDTLLKADIFGVYRKVNPVFTFDGPLFRIEDRWGELIMVLNPKKDEYTANYKNFIITLSDFRNEDDVDDDNSRKDDRGYISCRFYDENNSFKPDVTFNFSFKIDIKFTPALYKKYLNFKKNKE